MDYMMCACSGIYFLFFQETEPIRLLDSPVLPPVVIVIIALGIILFLRIIHYRYLVNRKLVLPEKAKKKANLAAASLSLITALALILWFLFRT